MELRRQRENPLAPVDSEKKEKKSRGISTGRPKGNGETKESRDDLSTNTQAYLSMLGQENKKTTTKKKK